MTVLKLVEIEDGDERNVERARRQDVSIEGVAQEALDVYHELEANKQSPREVLTEYGFLLCDVLKPAKRDEERIIKELGLKPSKDVAGGVLKVSDVKIKYSIDEFVPKVVEEEPEPEIVEPE